ncbi:MAG: PLD-like domain [Thermoplasmata archaeon]|jgi:hypothetical protein|nr:PLD-like domain [Thermoplasmata archaeon]
MFRPKLPRAMAAPNTFTVPPSQIGGWVSRLAAWRGTKGIDAVLREMEDAARKASPEGATVTRHQLFSWSEALQGQAAKLPLAGADAARQLAADLKQMLAGSVPPSAPAPPSAPPAPPAPPAPAWAAPAVTYMPPPPITYVKPPAPGAEGLRFLDTRDVGAAVQQLVRSATTEILVLSPWKGGLDTLVPELLATPPAVALRVISRAPSPDEPDWHRALQDLRRRGAEMVVSPFLHTRMLIVDGKALILGAASVPGPSTPYTRETALLVSDPAVVNAARLHFANVQKDARPS